MNINLEQNEVDLLKKEDVIFDSQHDYTEDEALDFLDQVRDLEVLYSQSVDDKSRELFILYGGLADKIQNIIDNA